MFSFKKLLRNIKEELVEGRDYLVTLPQTPPKLIDPEDLPGGIRESLYKAGKYDFPSWRTPYYMRGGHWGMYGPPIQQEQIPFFIQILRFIGVRR